jgi:hypothetical protein
VEGVSGKGKQKNSWLGVVEKCLKNKYFRSIKCKRKCQRIMSMKEASGVCKDRVKWRAICRGGKNKGR